MTQGNFTNFEMHRIRSTKTQLYSDNTVCVPTGATCFDLEYIILNKLPNPLAAT